MARPLKVEVVVETPMTAESSNLNKKRKRVDQDLHPDQINKKKKEEGDDSTGTPRLNSRTIQARREIDDQLLFRPGHISKDNEKRTGWFSPEEIQKLEQYKIEFCNHYRIRLELFNTTIQSSYKSKDGIFQRIDDKLTYKQFWKDVYSLLPERDRRSIYRFMRRHFQSGTTKAHHWTAEDDNQLEQLHDKLGPKWAAIARMLERTQDDVVQRWKNKVEHRSTMKEGPWDDDEIDKLLECLEDIREIHIQSGKDEDEIGKDIYDLTNDCIGWGAVSDRLGNKRSRQQCADKWRKIKQIVKRQRIMGDKDAVYEHSMKYRKAGERRGNRFGSVVSNFKSAERVEESSSSSSSDSSSEEEDEDDDKDDDSDSNSDDSSEDADSSEDSDNLSADEQEEDDEDDKDSKTHVETKVTPSAEDEETQSPSPSSPRSSSSAAETDSHDDNKYDLGAQPSQELGIEEKTDKVDIKRESSPHIKTEDESDESVSASTSASISETDSDSDSDSDSGSDSSSANSTQEDSTDEDSSDDDDDDDEDSKAKIFTFKREPSS